MKENKQYTAKVALRITADAFEEDDVIEIISDLFSPGDFYGITIESCEVGSIQDNERG